MLSPEGFQTPRGGLTRTLGKRPQTLSTGASICLKAQPALSALGDLQLGHQQRQGREGLLEVSGSLLS